MPQNNRNPDRAEVMSMQQDAIRRVREMQRRANEKLRQTQQAMRQEPQNSSENHACAVPPQSPQASRPAPAASALEKSEKKGSPLAILDRLGIDQEKGLLLLLIILLLNEGADTKLILALCYLLI